MSENEQAYEKYLLRRRQGHFHYRVKTYLMNPPHHDVMAHPHCFVRSRLFEQASQPLEGESMSFQIDLVALTQYWSQFATSSLEVPDTCPISFTDDEVKESSRLGSLQYDADCLISELHNKLGVSCDGWAPVEEYENVERRARECQRRVDATETSDEKRKLIAEHWPLGDYDKNEYE